MEYEEIDPDPQNFLENSKNLLCKRPVLLLGPPSIGKSYSLYNFLREQGGSCLFIAEDNFLIRQKKLINCVRVDEVFYDIDFSEYETIIVDDFFKATRKQLGFDKKFLGKIDEMIRDSDKNIVISTTPYRWVWLCEHYGDNECIARIKKEGMLCLCKTEKEKIEWELEDQLRDEKLKKKVVKLSHYKFDFPKAHIGKKKYKYDTYIRPSNFILQDFLSPISSGEIFCIPSDTLDDLVKDSLQDLTIATTILKEMERKSDFLEIVARHIGIGIAPLALFTLLRDIWRKKTGREAEERLVNLYKSFNRFTTHQLELIEWKRKLPPLSLINSKELLTKGRKELDELIERIEQHREELKEFIGKYEKHFEDVDRQLKSFRKKIGEIRKQKRYIVEIKNFIDKNVERAVLDISGYNPVRYLVSDNVVPDGTELHFVGRDKELKELMNWVDDGVKLIEIKGRAGVGKSTLAYHFGKELQKKGYLVGIPVLSRSLESLEENLKRRLESNQGRSIFIVEVKPVESEKGETLYLTRAGLNVLLNLLVTGLLSTLIVVYRDESYEVLREMLEPLRSKETVGRNRILESKKVLSVKGLDKDSVSEIIRNIWSDKKEIIDENLGEILRLGEIDDKHFNPLISILAASWIAQKGKGSLKGLTAHQFLKEYVNEVFFKKGLVPDNLRKAYRYIATARILEKDDLFKLFRSDEGIIEPGAWKEFLELLAPYEYEGYYRILPDIFNDVIFWSQCYENVESYTEIFLKKGLAHYLPGIAYNLAILFNNCRHGEIDVKRENVIKKANDFMSILRDNERDVHPFYYFKSLINLLWGDIPIAEEYIDYERLLDGLMMEAEFIKIDQKALLVNVFARPISNFSINNMPQQFIASLHNMRMSFENILDKIGCDKDDKEEFLGNVYSMIISRISDKKKPEEATEWFDGVIEHAGKTAEELGYDKEMFLLNVYSMIISRISDKKKPEEATEWFDGVIEHAGKTAEELGYDKKMFLLNVYSMIISRISDDKKPEEATEWFDGVIEHAGKTAEELGYDKEMFLGNVYSMIISRISDKKKPEEATEWFDGVIEHAGKTAEELGYDKEMFLGNVYSMIISRISDKKKPEEATEWFDGVIEHAGKTAEELGYDKEMFLGNVYSMIISRISDKKKPEEATEWFDGVIEHAGKTAEELGYDKEMFLLNVYSMIISMISDDKKPEEATEWFDGVIEHAGKTAEELGYDKEMFLGNVYSMIISRISDKKKPEEATEWFDGVIEHAGKTAEELGYDKEMFLLNVYSMIISMISDDKKPEEATEWFDGVIEHAGKTAEELGYDKEMFLLNVYSMIISMISDKKKPEEATEWFDGVIEHAGKTAEELGYDKKMFLLNVYSMIISKISDDKKPEEATEWFDGVIEHAGKTAEELGYDKKMFLLNVYSMIISKISDDKKPEEATEWFDGVIEHAGKTAEELGYDKKMFLLNVYSMIISKISDDKKPEEATEWFDGVIEHAGKTAEEHSEWKNFLAITYAAICFHITKKQEKNHLLYEWFTFLIKKNVIEETAFSGDLEVLTDFCIEVLTNFCIRYLYLIKEYSKNRQQDYNLLTEKILGIVEERSLIKVVQSVYSQIKADEELREMWERRFRCYIRRYL